MFAANFRAGELCMNFQLKMGNSENEKNQKLHLFDWNSSSFKR